MLVRIKITFYRSAKNIGNVNYLQTLMVGIVCLTFIAKVERVTKKSNLLILVLYFIYLCIHTFQSFKDM